jgi:hypothetical protein
MAEAALNTRILKALKHLNAFRVENACLPGTPDINFTHGWIEAKYLPRWPSKGGVVACRHFRPEQKAWHLKHALAGGVSYVVIQIDRTVLALDGKVAVMKLGSTTESELRALALGVWENKLDPVTFVKVMTERR